MAKKKKQPAKKMGRLKQLQLVRMLTAAEEFECAAVALRMAIDQQLRDAMAGKLEGQMRLPVMNSPYVVLSAFSVELYLKGLLGIETDHLYHGHDLRALFQLLSKPRQRLIETRYREWRKTAPDKSLPIGQTLRLSATAFEEWRYEFETDEPLRYAAMSLSRILRMIIRDSDPKFAHTFKNPPEP
jgi:HEPN domain-containing protein